MASKKKNRVAAAPAAVAPMPPAALDPPTLRDFVAAEQFLTRHPAVQQQILAAVVNAPAVNHANSTQRPDAGEGTMPVEWRRFQRNVLAKSALVSNDAPKHHGAYDQRMQLHADRPGHLAPARSLQPDVPSARRKRPRSGFPGGVRIMA